MKLKKGQLKKLMQKHVFDLTEEETKALAFILDINISGYKKNDHEVKFEMIQKLTIVFVEVSNGSCASMGKSKAVTKGISAMTCWGGVFSFAQIVKIFRYMYVRGYELTLQSPDSVKTYTRTEWMPLVLKANDLVEEEMTEKNKYKTATA